ncbi:AI-2E family transporter, partial [Mesorhizobium sp. M2D.F.Ca.ET.145.01.1.1]
MKAEPAALGAGVAEAEESRLVTRADTRLMRSLLIGIFLFMSIYALYFARAFFMPVILAFLLTLTLT